MRGRERGHDRASRDVIFRREESQRRFVGSKQRHSSSNICTFFFSNFSDSHGELDMLNIF